MPLPSEIFLEDNVDINPLIKRILALTDMPKGAKVLELPCGMGLNTDFIHRQGFEAMGIDADLDKIRKGLIAYPGLELYCHDIQNIFYVHYFNLVLLLQIPSLLNQKPFENGYMIKNLYSTLTDQGFLVLGHSFENSQKQNFEDFLGEILEGPYHKSYIRVHFSSKVQSSQGLPTEMILIQKMIRTGSVL